MLTASTATNPLAVQQWRDAAREHGAVALVDKAEGWTSFDCVARLRTLLQTRRIGHAGTLDPLATGLLIVCIGRATKTVDYFQSEEKTYTVTAKLGATTPTDDRGSHEEAFTDSTLVQPLSEAEVRGALQQFVGELIQVPPAFSAIRHGKKRQYDLAREGALFVERPRCVTVYDIHSVQYQWPWLSFTMRCSKGTYVRSLVRDVGRKLGCGAYVWMLRRTQNGGFGVEEALTTEQITNVLSESRQ